MLHALISKILELRQKTSPSIVTDETVTFRCFVEKRCLPIKEGTWSPAYRDLSLAQQSGTAILPVEVAITPRIAPEHVRIPPVVEVTAFTSIGFIALLAIS
jgi:hypothetical protein